LRRKRGEIRALINGTFIGQLSRKDLDKNRFDLREVNAQGVKS
jgi:hypothetical protein